MRRDHSLALRLAFSLLASVWTAESLGVACTEFVGDDADPAFDARAALLVAQVLSRYPIAPLDRARELARFILSVRAEFDQSSPSQTDDLDSSEDRLLLSAGLDADTAKNGEIIFNGFRTKLIGAVKSSSADDPGLGDESRDDSGDDSDDVDFDVAGVDDEAESDGLSDAAFLPQSASEPPVPGPFRMAVASAQMLRNRWGVPILHTVGELAEFLEVPLNDLQWFADRRGMQIRETKEQFHHYTYRWIPKRDGSFRLLEQPKPRLKQMQRSILRHIVGLIPLHDAAHGFVAGRSVISAALPHVHQRVLLRFDLQNFFGSVGAGKVFGIFRTCGYPEAVAHVLSGLVTNRVPSHVIAQHRSRSEIAGTSLRTPHLPQGAPTSPAIANLVAIGIDRRIAGLATKYNATYTRYADDLFVSGGQELLARKVSFCALSETIVEDEGFRVHRAKTLLITNAGRQRMLGLVVNEYPAVARTEFDTLRAVLHNCISTGPAAQRRHYAGDFRSRLLGRIGWVANTNSQRGDRLMALFNQISWSGLD